MFLGNIEIFNEFLIINNKPEHIFRYSTAPVITDVEYLLQCKVEEENLQKLIKFVKEMCKKPVQYKYKFESPDDLVDVEFIIEPDDMVFLKLFL